MVVPELRGLWHRGYPDTHSPVLAPTQEDHCVLPAPLVPEVGCIVAWVRADPTPYLGFSEHGGTFLVPFKGILLDLGYARGI